MKTILVPIDGLTLREAREAALWSGRAAGT
jgi:hypothetical protein